MKRFCFLLAAAVVGPMTLVRSSAQGQPRGQIGHADRVGLAGGQGSPIRDDREQAFRMRPRKPAPRHALKECLLPLPHLLVLVEGHRRHKLVGVDRVEAPELREDRHEVFLEYREPSGLP